VLSKFNRLALLLAHASSPKGQLRRMQSRKAFNSASVCGSLTQVSQRRGNVGSAGWVSQHGQAEDLWPRAQAEPQRHISARSTNPERTGFRST